MSRKKGKNIKRSIIITLKIVVLISFCIWTIKWGIYALSPPDLNGAEKVFKTDRELLESLVSYLEKNDADIYIHKYMSYDNIEDDEVIKAIDKLFKRGYDAIGKSGNTIIFLKWTRWRDFGAGIAYSINGENPQIGYLIKLEPLSEDGWYYYEAN